jgi:hypothetical protein
LVNAEEQGELCLPLIQERSPVDQHQGAAPPLGRKVYANHRLPRPGRPDEHAGFVLQEDLCSVRLQGSEFAAELESEKFAVSPLIVDDKTHPILVEEGLEIGAAPPRQGDVLGEFLSTGDHAGSERGGQSHPLFLVELGILECGQPLDLVEERGREAGLRDEQPLG